MFYDMDFGIYLNFFSFMMIYIDEGGIFNNIFFYMKEKMLFLMSR